MNRDDSIRRLRERDVPWDILVIGGGATGVAVAMDAADRGLDVALIERFDFGSGTSSRSTKLVHGGVRYLKQGNVTLVRDALRERSLLLQNAPHLVHDQSFLIPCANLWQWFFYGVGLKLYDWLAIGNRFGRSRFVSANVALTMAPALSGERLKGVVVYHDGQFDDARLLIDMAFTAATNGACLANFVTADELIKNDSGAVCGVHATDRETGQSFEIPARVVINAAGPFCDSVRRMDQPDCEPMVAASQGVHLVLPKQLYPGETAMIVPKTSDGRVIFIVPWHDRAIVGTTDTAIPDAVAEPVPKPDEVDFLLETASRYLARAPKRSDVRSVFTGIRPLVKGDKSSRTASLSRDHVIRVSDSKLVTITGGKWTTVRKMAEDCVDRVIDVASFPATPCRTKSMEITGADRGVIERFEAADPELAKPVHSSLNIRCSEVVFAARHEMARTVEDVLARRTRMLFLDSDAAIESAAIVASILAKELGTDSTWIEQQVATFQRTAEHYRLDRKAP